nr:hypothetical protein CFP56_78958 [Quercus suber]
MQGVHSCQARSATMTVPETEAAWTPGRDGEAGGRSSEERRSRGLDVGWDGGPGCVDRAPHAVPTPGQGREWIGQGQRGPWAVWARRPRRPRPVRETGGGRCWGRVGAPQGFPDPKCLLPQLASTFGYRSRAGLDSGPARTRRIAGFWRHPRCGYPRV